MKRLREIPNESTLVSTNSLGKASASSNGDSPQEKTYVNEYDGLPLIKEAKERQRRRQQRIGALLLGILAATAIAVRVGGGNNSTHASNGIASGHLPVSNAPNQSTVVLNRPGALALTPDGRLLVVNQGTNQILEVTQGNKLSLLAGNGRSGFRGDGGPAKNAEFRYPNGITVSATGNIYVADTGNNRIRRITKSGIISTIAGDGAATGPMGSQRALNAPVIAPWAVALGQAGQLYIADQRGIQEVTKAGTLLTVLKSGPTSLTINGHFTPLFPAAIAVTNNGDIFVADSSPKLLVELSPSGATIHSWPIYVNTAGLTKGAGDSILVADYGDFSIDQVQHGELTTIEKFQDTSVQGLFGIIRPSGIAESPNGFLFTSSSGVNGGTRGPGIVRSLPESQPVILIHNSH